MRSLEQLMKGAIYDFMIGEKVFCKRKWYETKFQVGEIIGMDPGFFGFLAEYSVHIPNYDQSGSPRTLSYFRWELKRVKKVEKLAQKST